MAKSETKVVVDPVDEKLPAVRLVPLALQHVLVMYAGAVAVPLILGRALKLSPEEVAFLISADLFACGIATIVQSFGFPGVGIRLPVMMGVTFASVGPMLAMAATPGVGLLGIYGSVIAAGVFGFLAIAFVYALVLNLRIMDRWLERPYLIVFPAIGAYAAFQLVRGIQFRDDLRPFRMTALIFGSAFATLAVSFWPYIIPFAVTIDQAAGPASSLDFMFWGAGLVVLPLTLGYTAVVYSVFRGKVADTGHYD